MGVDTPLRCYFCKRSEADKSIQITTSSKNESDLRPFPNVLGKLSCKSPGFPLTTKVIVCWECALIISAIVKGKVGGWEPLENEKK